MDPYPSGPSRLFLDWVTQEALCSQASPPVLPTWPSFDPHHPKLWWRSLRESSSCVHGLASGPGGVATRFFRLGATGQWL